MGTNVNTHQVHSVSIERCASNRALASKDTRWVEFRFYDIQGTKILEVCAFTDAAEMEINFKPPARVTA